MKEELMNQYDECLDSLNQTIREFKTMAKMLRENGLDREAGYLEGYATNYMTGFEDDALNQVYEGIEECEKD